MKKFLMVAMIVMVAAWLSSVRAHAVTITFTESGGIFDGMDIAPSSTATADVPKCISGAAVPPCVLQVMGGTESASIALLVPAGLFASTTVGNPPLGPAIAFLTEPESNTISDKVSLNVDPTTTMVSINFFSDANPPDFGTRAGGFTAFTDESGLSTPVKLPLTFFTGDPLNPAAPGPHAYQLPAGYLVQAKSDVEIPEPSSLLLIGAGLLGIAAFTAKRRVRRGTV